MDPDCSPDVDQQHAPEGMPLRTGSEQCPERYSMIDCESPELHPVSPVPNQRGACRATTRPGPCWATPPQTLPGSLPARRMPQEKMKAKTTQSISLRPHSEVIVLLVYVYNV